MFLNKIVYCKLVIISHVPIFAIFVCVLNDESKLRIDEYKYSCTIDYTSIWNTFI